MTLLIENILLIDASFVDVFIYQMSFCNMTGGKCEAATDVSITAAAVLGVRRKVQEAVGGATTLESSKKSEMGKCANMPSSPLFAVERVWSWTTSKDF